MDGEPPQEEDFSQIPIIERSQHKNWKARVSAYTEVIAKSAKTASDSDPFFRPYVSDGTLLKRWCLDSNVVAQERGVEAVLAIVQYSGETSARTRSDVVPALVDKGLGSTRAGTKRKAGDLCAMYVEVENTGDGVVTDVLVGLDSKQPKAVAGTVLTLKELVESFGIPALGNVKPILKSIPKIFAHSDKTVRAEGTSLAITLHSYLGDALLPSLSDLKPVQMAELQKGFETTPGGSAKPARFTRKAQREREEAGPGGAEEVAEAAEPAALDPRSFLDPVNVLKSFPPDLMDLLASSKWKERLEALEACNLVLADPQNGRISDSNVDAYGPLASTLGAKCKSDMNVNVVMEAAKLLEGLCKGMGHPFGRYRSVTMPGQLERLKERKANVVEALGKSLDAMFASTSLQDIVDDVLSALKSKNPQVKEGTLKFLHRSLCTTTDAPGKDQIKPVAESLVALLGDSAEPVRTSAADCLGTMMKILGERLFNPFLDGVGDLQLAKVKDAFEKAEIRYRTGGSKPAAAPVQKAAPPSKVATRPSPSSSSSGPSSFPIRPAKTMASPAAKPSAKFDSDELVSDFAPPARAPPARFGGAKAATTKPPAPSSGSTSPTRPAPIARKPPITAAGPSKPAATSAKSAVPSTSKAGSSKTLAVSPSDPIKYRFTPEDAAAQAEQLIPADYHAKLADSAWKVRLEAAEELLTWISDGGAQSVDAEVMMRFLAKTPGWGEKNFQVSAKVYEVMRLTAERSPTFGRAAAALAIGPLTDKLGDIKLKKPSGEALTAFAEKISLAFVLGQSYEPMTKQKAPKAQADALGWIKQQLIDFGIAGIPLREMIGFLKVGLGSPNAAVRSSATQALVTVKIFVGADISGFLEDLNPQLLSTINSEFDKVAGQTPPEATRQQADLREASAGPGKASKGGADPLDDLIPRVDLDKLVASTSLIADSKSEAWKVRKEAFEALSGLLEVKSNSRLKPNMGEVGAVLKKAMADTNLAVKILALSIISKIALGMGQPFDKHLRLLTAPVCSVCADQKSTTRTAAVNTLTAMADAAGALDHMYAGLATSLENPNPALRSSVLGWLAERLQTNPPSSHADLTPLAAPLLSCLEDRNGDVRKAGGAVLPFVVASAGFEYVMEQTSGLKPASKATIVPLINNARSATGAGPSKPSVLAPSDVSAAASATPRAKLPSAKIVANSSPVARLKSPAPTTRPVGVAGRSLAMKALSSAPVTRPPSSLSSGDDRPTGLPKARVLPRPATSATYNTSAVPTASSSRSVPFSSANPDARLLRLKKDTSRWVLDPSPHPKADLSDYLAQQMELNVPSETYAQLFSKDHRAEEDFMAALTSIADFYSDQAATTYELDEAEVGARQVANVDLALKYAAMRLLGNNSQLNNRCLEVISRVVETMTRLNERLGDAEVKLFVPALVFKLGDAKFVPKLQPIFDALGTVTATSQILGLLVQYGLDDKSAGKTCKNEALQLIEKAYKRRGSILRIKDERGFYETVAKCISDSGTRQAALSLMALLQIQGSSPALQQVVDGMPAASKDMLANRRATMAASKPTSSSTGLPIVAKVSASAIPTEGSPSRLQRPLGSASPGLSRLPKTSVMRAESPEPRNLPVASGSKPRSAIPSPAPRKTAMSSLPRTTQTGPPDAFGTSKPALQPLRKTSGPTAPLPLPPQLPPLLPTNGHAPPQNDVLIAIDAIRQDDIDSSVDALKTLQDHLLNNSEAFRSCTSTLVDTLCDELDRVFNPPTNLLDMAKFRLVKHLLQATNNLSANQDLMRRLKYADIYTLIYCLSLRLVQADRMGGSPKELAGFMNQIMIQIMSMAERDLVFKVMFRLLIDLSGDFSQTRPEHDSEVVAHADLVLKCLWKRCRVIDDDLRHGRVQPGTMLNILEDFTQAVNPMEYRKREAEGVALGELPLRTIKTIMQRIIIYAKETDQEVFDILRAEFGDRAADTIVYSYIFRLLGKDEAAAAQNRHRNRSPLLPVLNGNGNTENSPPQDYLSAGFAPRGLSPVTPVEEPTSEAEALIKGLGSHNQKSQLDKVHAYITANPDKEVEVQKAISAHLSDAVQIYVRRALEQRKAAASPPAARETVSPVRSPGRPVTLPASKPAPRRSLAAGPRPSSVAVDKSAPIDDQLSAYKALFNRGLGASQTGSAGGSPGEPLREIDQPQALDSSID